MNIRTAETNYPGSVDS